MRGVGSIGVCVMDYCVGRGGCDVLELGGCDELCSARIEYGGVSLAVGGWWGWCVGRMYVWGVFGRGLFG